MGCPPTPKKSLLGYLRIGADWFSVYRRKCWSLYSDTPDCNTWFTSTWYTDQVNWKISGKFSPHPLLVPSDYHQILLHGLHQGSNRHQAPSNDKNKMRLCWAGHGNLSLTTWRNGRSPPSKEYTTLAFQPWDTKALCPHTFISSLLSSGTHNHQVCYCTPLLLVH
jgi:hypothetical protein